MWQLLCCLRVRSITLKYAGRIVVQLTEYSFLKESTASGSSVPEFQVASSVDFHQTMLHLFKQAQARDVMSVLETFPVYVLDHGCDTARRRDVYSLYTYLAARRRTCYRVLMSPCRCGSRLLKHTPVLVAPW